MNIIANLENFTGENWNAYKEQLECFFLLNNIAEEKKVPLLITKLSTNVYELLTTLCIPGTPVKEKYETICDKLQKHYHPVKNYILEQAEFRKRSQKRDENIEQYVLELKNISKNCGFKNLDDEIKERLLNGTRCDAVRFEILKQAELPLHTLINVAKTVEAAYNLAFNREKEEEKPQMFQLQEENINRNKNYKTGVGATCFCCGKIGHIKAQCTLRVKFCSECGTRGHIFKMCNKTESNWRMKTLNTRDAASSEATEIRHYEKDTVEAEIFNIFCVSEKSEIPSAKLCVLVNGNMLDFEVDTGADVSTITLSDKKQYFPNLEVKQRNVKLTNFDQSTSTPLGVLEDLHLSYGIHNISNQKLLIVKDGLPRIMGKIWLSALQLWPPKFEQGGSEATTEEVTIKKSKSEFNSLFKPDMGQYKGEPIHLEIEADVQPTLMPERTVRFTKDETARLEKKRIAPCTTINKLTFTDEIILELRAYYLSTTKMKEIAHNYILWSWMDNDRNDITENYKIRLQDHKPPETNYFCMGRVPLSATYEVEVDGQQWKRSANRLLQCSQTLDES